MTTDKQTAQPKPWTLPHKTDIILRIQEMTYALDRLKDKCQTDPTDAKIPKDIDKIRAYMRELATRVQTNLRAK